MFVNLKECWHHYYFPENVTKTTDKFRWSFTCSSCWNLQRHFVHRRRNAYIEQVCFLIFLYHGLHHLAYYMLELTVKQRPTNWYK